MNERIIIGCLIVVALLLAGCAPNMVAVRARGAHEALNTVTDIVDPAYGLAVELCDAREAVIVQRQGTTLEQDQEAILDIRATCDRVFQTFTAIRELQLQARAAVQATLDRPNDAAYAAALAVIAKVNERWGELQRLLRETGLVRPAER